MAVELNEVEKAIETRKLRWTAGETPIRFGEAGDGRFGLRPASLKAPELRFATTLGEAKRQKRPRRHDWRELGRVSPIKNQATCGACVAFATCAAMESALAIAEESSDFVDLAEADLFFCGCGDCCDKGWDFVPALAHARGGVGLEANFPYAPPSQCQPVAKAAKIVDWRTLHSAEDRRYALFLKGPVIAGMRVYEDFMYYTGGIYEHAAGVEVGLHAACIVGYDDDASCWIMKNSWDEDWGEQGFCRIAYGQCDLDQAFPFISPDVARL